MERLLIKLTKLVFLSYALAWLLACTSVQTYSNIPIAIVVILLLHSLSKHLIFSSSVTESMSPRSRRYRKFYDADRSDFYYKEKVRDPPDRDAWKKLVNAPIVESAWESFCGSIIQEWIYDSWFSMISPDREFPAEVRRLMNEAFAEIAQRAKKVDLRTLLLRDMCDLFTEQLELYRSTKLAVGILNEGDISLASKDRAFQLEMKTDHTLHAAFYSRDGHYRMIKRMAEGVVGIILKKADLQRPILRSLGRELLATCVLRNVVMLFSPYNANKILLSLLTPKKDSKIHTTTPNTGSSSCASAEHLNGRFQFEQRVRNSVVLEELANKKIIQKPKPLSTVQNNRIPISRSHPNLKALEKTKELEDSAEIKASALNEKTEGCSKEPEGEFDPKGGLEETDLLEGAKSDSETLEASAFQAKTSLPWIHTSPPSNAAMEDGDRLPGLIDSSIPIEDISFVGHPRARVCAPEINNNGGREYVVFKIRVADQTGEWTVTRRYRNFEALHKILRDLPAYQELGPRLPPKTYMFQSHKTEVVEQRRIALDKYLQTILSCEALAFNRHVWLFLSDQGCRSFTPDIRVGLVKIIANNMDNARYSIKRTFLESLGEGRSSADLKKENGLRLLDGSECSSMCGSIKIDDESDTASASLPLRPPNSDRQPSQVIDIQPRGNVTFPEGTMQTNNGTITPRGQTRRQKQFAAFRGDNDKTDSKLPGDLSNANLLSRFDYEDRDAIGRQVDRDSAATAAAAKGSIRLRRVMSWSKLINGGISGSEEDDDRLELEFDDYSGISAPLYEVADAIFDFPAQKFFRRQVFQVMRQVLSFLAGDAIDVYLNQQIKRLRSEHTLARMIHYLKSMLWPGGVWFITANNAAQDSTQQQTSKASDKRNKGLRSDKYLDPAEVATDTREMAENLRTRLFRHAPAALVRLVGRRSYMGAMKDVYDMIQLPTFVRQIGYGVLEIVLLALFPELKDLFARIHKEARFMPESRR